MWPKVIWNRCEASCHLLDSRVDFLPARGFNVGIESEKGGI